MKRKWIYISIVVLVILVVLGKYYLKYSKEIQESNKDLHITQGDFTIIAKQKGEYIEYFVKSDPYSVYNYLSSISLEKAKYSVFGDWKYKVILTDTLTPDGNGGWFIPNDTSDSIYIYSSCLEINGTVYLFRENDKVLEWFDNFYLNNVDNYEKYIIGE